MLSAAPSRRVTYRGVTPGERIDAARRVPRHDRYIRSLTLKDAERRRFEGETAFSI